MENVLITATDLHRGYDIGKKRIEVLRGINLEINRGERSSSVVPVELVKLPSCTHSLDLKNQIKEK